jgi:hypothetical protein
MTDDFLIQERDELKRNIEVAAIEDETVVGVLAIGSTAQSGGDVYSDLDYYFYTQKPNWSRADMDSWLEKRAMRPVFHYWTGIEKHHMLIDHTRVDISTKPRHHQEDLSLWPHLFFDEKCVVKDMDGVLSDAIKEHKSVNIIDGNNDQSAYIFNVILVTQQLLRGEVINAFSRMTGVIESKARLIRAPRLEFGTARWREATRKVEQEIGYGLPSELREIIHIQNSEELKKWLTRELTNIKETEKSLQIKETVSHLLDKLNGV